MANTLRVAVLYLTYISDVATFIFQKNLDLKNNVSIITYIMTLLPSLLVGVNWPDLKFPIQSDKSSQRMYFKVIITVISF